MRKLGLLTTHTLPNAVDVPDGQVRPDHPTPFSSGTGGAVGASLVKRASQARAPPAGLTTEAALGVAYGLPSAARNALMQYSTSKAAFICGEPTSLMSKSIYTSRSRSTIDAASHSIFSLVRTSVSLKCSKVFLASATAVLTSVIFPFATRAMRSAFDGLRSSKYSPELGLCFFPPIHNSLVFMCVSQPRSGPLKIKRLGRDLLKIASAQIGRAAETIRLEQPDAYRLP